MAVLRQKKMTRKAVKKLQYCARSKDQTSVSQNIKFPKKKKEFVI